MKKIAAIYIRVSTDYQAEEGYSIEAQKEQLTAYCVSKRIKDYDYYIDGGWSGSNIDRPEIQRLIADVKEDKISHVIVYKLDRLSRSQKDTLFLIEDVFNPHGVDFVSLNESMDTSTPMGRLMIGILSAFAQLERENIKLRTRMGMKERVKTGKWMGGGNPPFGFDYDRNQGILVPNQDAEKVRQIYSLYIEGYTPQNIATMLGLKYDRLIVQILRRKNNYGSIEYKGEEYKGAHQAIISKETYDRAMQCMEERKVVRATNNSHLLTGLIYCGKCGARMRYVKWSKKGYRIACYSRLGDKEYMIKDANCDQEYFWADEVEEIVIKSIMEFADNYTSNNNNNNPTKKINAVEMLQQQQKELNKQLRKLYLVYAESDDEDNILLDTIEDIKAQINKVSNKLIIERNAEISKKIKDEKILMCSTIKNLWDIITPLQQRNIVKKLIDKITITDSNVHINFNI